MKTGGNFDETLTRKMFEQKGGPDGGSVTLLRPDGSEYPGSPFTGAVSPAPGLQPSTATTTSGSPTSPLRKVRSCNSAASAPRTARLA